MALAVIDLLTSRDRRMEYAGDWWGGNRELGVMQQGRVLTDLCWNFVFISRIVTDELHNKIPTDCRGCRNYPFFARGRKYKQEREEEKSYFSALHLSSVFTERKISPSFSAVLASCDVK